jgi:hypothetical protein
MSPEDWTRLAQSLIDHANTEALADQAKKNVSDWKILGSDSNMLS